MKVVMDKPWELKVEDKRSFDTLFTFIIFCEDESFAYPEWHTDFRKVEEFFESFSQSLPERNL